MSLLDQLKSKKSNLKPTVTNITYADGSQEQIIVSKADTNETNSIATTQLKPKTFGFVIDTKPDHIPACILSGFLYLGSQDSVMLETVERYHLTDILSVGIESPNTDINYGDGRNSTIRNYFIECLDLPDTQLDMIIKQTNEIIHSVYKRNGRILVHCNAGVSRSSTVCIAYLMFHRKMHFSEAFKLVKSKRECIRPNDGFLNQLKEMDQLVNCS